MNKGPVVILLILLSLTRIADAQRNKPRVLSPEEVKAVKKDGASMFSYGDYAGALKAYLELIKADPENPEYNYRIGYSYLMTNINKPAALSYLEVAIEAKDVKKEWFYYLGMAYMHNEMWDEAIKAFGDSKSGSSSKPIKGMMPVDRMIEMCRNGKELMAKPVSCTFTNPGKAINTSQDESNPNISSDGRTLVFTSRRKGNAGGFIEELNYFLADIYWTSWKDTIWTKAKNAGANVNMESDEVSVGISQTGDKIFVYFDNNSETFDDIGVATLKGKIWQKPVMLPPQVNSIEYEGAACMTGDGRTIYFSSARKGGIGGIDIWMVNKENGEWGPAVNLGNTINSTYDEESPFLTLDGKKLYFASKGWNSMGDYDIFYCEWNENEKKWGSPINAGYPINNADDNSYISFTGDERFAYITAVRPGGFGERDIYRIEFTDTLHHKFEHLITGSVSGVTGHIEVTKMTLQNKQTSQTTQYEAWTATNYFVFPTSPGDYVLHIEGSNFASHDEEITVTNEFPPVEVNRIIKVSPAK